MYNKANHRKNNRRYGWRAARGSLLLPGLGQFINRQYLKGLLALVLCVFPLTTLAFALVDPKQNLSPTMVVTLALTPLAVWALSILEAYHSAIATRERDAQRHDIQILTTLKGYDVTKNSFEELVVTKNLSRSGACLIMSREVQRGSSVLLEFQNLQKVKGRVVWARETGNRDEHVVGVELRTPLHRL